MTSQAFRMRDNRELKYFDLKQCRRLFLFVVRVISRHYLSPTKLKKLWQKVSENMLEIFLFSRRIMVIKLSLQWQVCQLRGVEGKIEVWILFVIIKGWNGIKIKSHQISTNFFIEKLGAIPCLRDYWEILRWISVRWHLDTHFRQRVISRRDCTKNLYGFK